MNKQSESESELKSEARIGKGTTEKTIRPKRPKARKYQKTKLPKIEKEREKTKARGSERINVSGLVHLVTLTQQ